MQNKLSYSCTMTLLASAVAACFSPTYASTTGGPVGGLGAQSADNAKGQTVSTSADTTAAAKRSTSSARASRKVTDAKNLATLSTVNVTGQLASLRRQAAVKQDAVGVVDSISAEETGKFPDQNVAEALQRVPGVSVNRTGGQANQVTVRGFGPTFVTVLLNGRPIATASPNRAFDFDVLPSSVIQTAVVHKTSPANLEAGGIGGTIDVITALPLDFHGFHASGSVAGLKDNLGSGFSGKTTPKVQGMIGDTSSDHRFGWLAAISYSKEDHVSQSQNTFGWIPNLNYTQFNPSYNNISLPASLEGQVTRETRTRKSFDGAIEWNPIDKLHLTLNGLYSEYKVNSVFNAFGSYANANDIQSLTADANGTAQNYTRFNTGVLSNDQIIQSTPGDTKSQLLGANALYQLSESTEIDWDTSKSKAWNKPSGDGYEFVLGTRNYGYNPVWTNNGNTHLPSTTGILSPTDASDLRAHYFTIGSQNVSDQITRNALHLSTSFSEGVLSRLDFGAENENQTKTEVNYDIPNGIQCATFCGYVATVPANVVDARSFKAGSLVNGVAPGFPTSWLTFDPNKLLAYYQTPAAYGQTGNAANFASFLTTNGGVIARADPGTYSQIKEHTKAAYAMADLQGSLGAMPWTLDLGMRYTKTQTTSIGYSQPVLSIVVQPNNTSNTLPTFGPLQPISDRGSYSNWLPSAAFKLNLRDDLIFRLAASKSLSRPDLSNLAQSTSYSFLRANLTKASGNAGLQPYTSKNLDTGLEWYIDGPSYVALDVFHKKVSNFSTLITTPVDIFGFPFQLTEPVNLNTATIKGAEFTFNYQFTHLPAPFNGLGVATNYTYVTSSASISPQVIATSGKFAVPGIGNSANVSTYFALGPVQLRLAYNWRASYLSSIAGDESQPTTVKSYGQVDFSSSYKLNDHVSLFVDATNLTNETIHNYQVYLDRESYAEKNGRTFYLGLRASL